MANLNRRQVEFLNDLKTFATDIENLYGRAHALQKKYTEQFAVEKDHELDNCDNLETEYFYDSIDVENAVNGLVGFINFWIGLDVETREYGKDFRRIK